MKEQAATKKEAPAPAVSETANGPPIQSNPGLVHAMLIVDAAAKVCSTGAGLTAHRSAAQRHARLAAVVKEAEDKFTQQWNAWESNSTSAAATLDLDFLEPIFSCPQPDSVGGPEDEPPVCRQMHNEPWGTWSEWRLRHSEMTPPLLREARLGIARALQFTEPITVTNTPMGELLQGRLYMPYSVVYAQRCGAQRGQSCICHQLRSRGSEHLHSPSGQHLMATVVSNATHFVVYLGLTQSVVTGENFLRHAKGAPVRRLLHTITDADQHFVVWHAAARLGWGVGTAQDGHLAVSGPFAEVPEKPAATPAVGVLGSSSDKVSSPNFTHSPHSYLLLLSLSQDRVHLSL
jgi:hypothetical protein